MLGQANGNVPPGTRCDVLNLVICHQSNLLAESLSRVIREWSGYDCHILNPAHNPTVEFDFDIDVLLLESSLPAKIVDMIVNRIRVRSRRSKILLVVPCHVAGQIVEFARLGANGCILEDASLDELRRAIHDVNEGRCYCSPSLASSLFSHFGESNVSLGQSLPFGDIRLTTREREILELITWERLGNKQIAKRLSISQYTVKNHVHNIIEKLGAQDRYEAADLAVKHRLLSASVC